MTKFIIKAGDLKKFLETVSCIGTLQFKAKGKVEAPLFSAFFIDVDKEEQLLSVLTIDTFFMKIKQNATIKAKVIEAGVIEITNYKRFKSVFEGVSLNGDITITSDDDAIYIVSEAGDEYKLRIMGDGKLDEVYESKNILYDWKEAHSEVEIEVEKRGEIEKRIIWKITIGGASALYPMKIRTTKDQLKKFVNDSIKLTKDNSTVIKSEKGEINIHTGAPNATNSSKHPIYYVNAGKELINFKAKFAGLQAIVTNLLDEVCLSFRKTGEETIIIRIDSSNGNIHQTIAIGSEDKDGVLWDDGEESKID